MSSAVRAEKLCVPWMWAFKTIPNCSEDDGGDPKWYILTFTMSIVWIGIISFVRACYRWRPP